MIQPYSAVRFGYRPTGTTHFTADGERTLCCVGIRNTFDVETLTSKPDPTYFHAAHGLVTCPGCLKHLRIAGASAEEARQQEIARYTTKEVAHA